MSLDMSLKTIKKYANEGTSVFVDFSGGRYSVVLLHLVLRALGKARAVYVDTTISLPECDDFVRKTCDEWGVDLITLRREDVDFWGMVKRWGFPHRRFRWCMNEFKSIPLRLFNESNGEKILHLTGTSKHESSFRKKIYDVRGAYHYNYSVRSLCLHPLLDWAESMILDYIEKEQLPVNPCYSKYLGSGNCYYCPFVTSLLYYSNLASLQPQLFSRILEAEKAMRKGGGALYLGKGKTLRLCEARDRFGYAFSRSVKLSPCEAKAATKTLFSCQKRCLM